MNTKFITVEVELEETPARLHSQIEVELQQHGEPLRWAIANIDIERHKAIVEAIVTLDS